MIYKIILLIFFSSTCHMVFSQNQKLKVEGSIIISDSESQTPVAGTIRWTGQDFEGYFGTEWKSLSRCDGDALSNTPVLSCSSNFVLDNCDLTVNWTHDNPVSNTVNYDLYLYHDTKPNGIDAGPSVSYPATSNTVSICDPTMLNINSGSGSIDVELKYWYDGDFNNPVSAGTCSVNYDFGSNPDPDNTILFQENFDAQANWTSGDAPGSPSQQGVSDGIPSGWFMVRQTPKWAPSTGHPDRNEAIEILDSNIDKARGGVGKSAVFWRESRDNYANDKIMLYKFDEGQESVYVEFYIRFAPDWTIATNAGNVGKVFRVYAWDDVNTDNPFVFFADGNAGPMYLWNYSVNDYGVRNNAALRGGPYGENYTMSTPLDFPRPFIPGSLGSTSLNLTENTVGQAPGGTTPQIPDLINGGFLSDDMSQTVLWPQLHGHPDSLVWTKMAYYVSMNSAPGVADGVLSQWINDERVLHNTNIPWVGPTDEDFNRVKWNLVGIGGNDYFQIYPESDRRKEWYAIDDILIRNTVPNSLAE